MFIKREICSHFTYLRIKINLLFIYLLFLFANIIYKNDLLIIYLRVKINLLFIYLPFFFPYRNDLLIGLILLDFLKNK